MTRSETGRDRQRTGGRCRAPGRQPADDPAPVRSGRRPDPGGDQVDAARQLSKMFEPYHALAYYCPEIGGFGDCRLPGLVARLLRVPLGPARPGTRSRRRGRLLQLRPPHGRPGHPRRVVGAATGAGPRPPPGAGRAGAAPGAGRPHRRPRAGRRPHGSPAAPSEGCDAAGRPLYAAHDARDVARRSPPRAVVGLHAAARAPRRRAQRGARRGRGRRRPPATC